MHQSLLISKLKSNDLALHFQKMIGWGKFGKKNQVINKHIKNKQTNKMKFSAAYALAACGSAAAFTPTSKSQFCAGLPGALAPVGEFDPLGLSEGLSINELKRYREAEVTHGRVAMMATLGYLVAENFHPLFGGQISGPANSHLGQVEQVAPIFFFGLAIAIGNRELERALTRWEKPSVAAEGDDGYALLRKDYYPGDIGFDPLGLKPEDPEEFAEMQTKELQHGRLAMLASMGMIVQELVTNEPLLTTLKGYF